MTAMLHLLIKEKNFVVTPWWARIVRASDSSDGLESTTVRNEGLNSVVKQQQNVGGKYGGSQAI